MENNENQTGVPVGTSVNTSTAAASALPAAETVVFVANVSTSGLPTTTTAAVIDASNPLVQSVIAAQAVNPGVGTNATTVVESTIEHQESLGAPPIQTQQNYRVETPVDPVVEQQVQETVMPSGTYRIPMTATELVAGGAASKETKVKSDDEDKTLSYRPNATNTIQEYAVSSTLTKDMENADVLLSLPTDTTANIDAALSKMPNIDVDSTEDGNQWANIIRAASITTPYRNWFGSTVERPDAQYKQYVDSERGKLAAATPKLKNPSANKLTGERAVLHVLSVLGLGSTIQIPLWHSGFWITLKAPSEGALLELNRRLMDEKISLGRATYGLSFANTSVMYAGWLMDFALEHMYDSTLKADIEGGIRNYISTLDIPIIAWGLACVIWPRGFPYARAVLDQESNTNKIIKEKLEVTKLLWTDNLALTAWQSGHMSARWQTTTTAADLERYRSEFTRGKGRTVSLMNGCDVTFRVPNLDQYLISGQKWVNGIVTMVDKAFGIDKADQARDRYISQQGKASNMRQFAHWVESITVDGIVFDEVETIEMTMDALSGDDSVRNEFFPSVRKFIEDATISIVAIPITENAEMGDLPRFPHLLPLDTMSVFFILLGQKTEQIQDRS